MAIGWVVVALLLGCCPMAGAQPASLPSLREIQTPFYVLRTDLPDAEVREITVRMTAMAQEYAARTAHFGRRVPAGMTFVVFRHPDDYEAAGGRPGTDGQFDPETGVLMAVFGAEANRQTWHTIQHEGFHQFTHLAIGNHLPPWLSEGLAEYFGEAVFTGDSYVTGILRPERLGRLRERLEAGQLTPFVPFMLMSHEQWNGGLDAAHYDQAWAMVHFLMTAENGRYLPLFERFVLLCNRGNDWQAAWRATFGPAEAVERLWVRWVQGLGEDPTRGLRQAATLRTLTSFWARAEAVGQRIEEAEELLRLGEVRSLSYPESQWLPPSLIEAAAAEMKAWQEAGVTLEIRPVPDDPDDHRFAKERLKPERELALHLPDGTLLLGRFNLTRQRVTEVELSVEPGPSP